VKKLVTVRCEACGKEATYPANELYKFGKAFDDGWDLPDYCPVTTCPDCPSSLLIIKREKEKP